MTASSRSRSNGAVDISCHSTVNLCAPSAGEDFDRDQGGPRVAPISSLSGPSQEHPDIAGHAIRELEHAGDEMESPRAQLALPAKVKLCRLAA